MSGANETGYDCLKLCVSGRVQGVGFREWTRRLALSLKITGWVRNDTGGTVSCECRGTEAALEAFIKALRRGPPLARVEKITKNRITGASAYRRFEII